MDLNFAKTLRESVIAGIFVIAGISLKGYFNNIFHYGLIVCGIGLFLVSYVSPLIKSRSSPHL